jgi:hypothetical protein
MRELAQQAATGTVGSTERGYIKNEVDKLASVANIFQGGNLILVDNFILNFAMYDFILILLAPL